MHNRPIFALVVALCVGAQIGLPLSLWGKEIAPQFRPCCVETPPQNVRFLLAQAENAYGTKEATPSVSDKGQFISKPLLLSAAWTVGMGALAYWSKDRANRAYRSYMSSANTQRQIRYYDRAQRYDRLAGASFIGMEFGVVLTSYLTFFRR